MVSAERAQCASLDGWNDDEFLLQETRNRRVIGYCCSLARNSRRFWRHDHRTPQLCSADTDSIGTAFGRT